MSGDLENASPQNVQSWGCNYNSAKKKKIEGKSIQWKGNPDAMVQWQEHIHILSKAAP